MNDNLKIAVNSSVIFIRLVVISLVGIISSRYVLDALGASDFGLYNVVGSVVTLLNVFNSAMLSTTYRYIAFEIGKRDEGNPNKVFNACFAIHACFALFIVGLGFIVGDWYIDNYLNVDFSKIDDAHFVFHISIITTAVSTLLVPFQGLIVAFEKFTVNAIIDILTTLLRFAVILLFIYSEGNRLRIYSVIMFCCYTLSSLAYYTYCLCRFRRIIRPRIIREVKIYKEMLSYAFWTMIGAVAIVGKTQGSKILINYFFGTIVNAAYAIATQLESFILTFARSLSNAAIPQITKNFSGGNKGRSIKLTSYISKYTFILMSLVAFPVILEMDFLLGLWLKEVPDGSVIFCKLIVLNGLLSCLGEGIPALVNATGNIKTYQIVYQTFNFLGLPIAFIVYKLGYSPYSLLVVYCIINFLCAFVRVFLLKRIFDFDVKQFVRTSYLRVFYISIPLCICYLFYDSSNFSTIQHVLGLLFAAVFVIVSVSLLGLDSQERPLVKSTIIRVWSRIKGRHLS